MAKKKTIRRRRKTWSITGALESWIYAEIIVRGTTGSGVLGFFTGATDLGQGPGETFGGITTYTDPVGAGEISLGDLMDQPALAIATITGNFRSNLIPMAFASFSTSILFNISRRLLRKPMARITKDLVKPLLGNGIRM